MQAQKTVWTILKILDWTRQYFASKGVENPRLDAEVLLCAVLRKSRIQLYTNFDEPLQENELEAVSDLRGPAGRPGTGGLHPGGKRLHGL